MSKLNKAVYKFGEALHEIRKAKKWTQLQLAEELGLDIAYISRIERGEKNISLSTVVKIADLLGLEVTFGKYKLSKEKKSEHPKVRVAEK
jgi:transcriptional regulator with XRE-family HTH domain